VVLFQKNMISEEKRTSIKKEAQDILKNFSKALVNIKIEKSKPFMSKSKGFREENGVIVKDDDFRESMFKNAPQHDDECIIAEKKQW